MEILTQTMLAFKASFLAGIDNVKPMALGLFHNLLLLDLAWALISVVLNEGNLFKTIAVRLVRYGIFFYFIDNYNTVFEALVNTIIQVGLAAGGNTMSVENFADPSWLMEAGAVKLQPVKLFLLKNISSGLSALGSVFVIGLVYLGLWLAFIIMAVQVFITYVEIYMVGTMCLYFLACGVNKHTAFLAEKAVGTILSFSIKLGMLALIISVAEPTISNLPLLTSEDDRFFEACMALLAIVITIAFLCWQSPALAAGLMSGSPSLSGGSVAGAVMAAGAGAMALGMGASAVGGAVSSGMGAISDLMGGGGNNDGGLGNTIKAATAAAGTESSSNMPGSFSSGGDNGASLASQMSPDTIAENTGGSSSSSANSSDGANSGQPSLASQMSADTIAANTTGGSNESGQTGSTSQSGNESGATESNVGSPVNVGNDGSSTSVSGDEAATSDTTSNASAADASGAADGASTANADVPPVDSNENTQAEDGGKEKSGTSLSQMAGNIALVQQAIPPEASPSGGVNAPIQNSDD